MTDILQSARRVLRLETEALHEVERRLGDGFVRAVELVHACEGRVIVSGVGKSGVIAQKIAATLTSTGTPASFLHPTEGLHGDLGLVRAGDVAILLSKSGESDELLTLLQHLKRLGANTIALTGEATSALAQECDAVIDCWVREEACPHNLAPTTSTTATLALGDALAVVVLERKGFRAEDFARLHPGGKLGKRLLRTRDIMEAERLPIVAPNAAIRDVAVLLAERRGLVVICAEGGAVAGVFTAGDFARLMKREGSPFHLEVGPFMTSAPSVAHDEELASAVVYRMQQKGIMAMPVINATHTLVGVVHLHDLMRAGVV